VGLALDWFMKLAPVDSLGPYDTAQYSRYLIPPNKYEPCVIHI